MISRPRISVIVPTHNPHPERFVRTIEGLRAQTFDLANWELLVVDNASKESTAFQAAGLSQQTNARLSHEPQLGLTPARLCGFRAARGEIFVLVDDDNVLAPDYLAQVAVRFDADPLLGAAGGKSLPEFELPPPTWTREFDGLLALRDAGNLAQHASWSGTPSAPGKYPSCAPIGAGMALRRAAATAYANALDNDPRRRAFDRTGTQLVSGGDNDLVMTTLETGASVAYFPELVLTHLIPAERGKRAYLGALNRAIARSWVRVLGLHGILPWPAVSHSTVQLRKLRAWFRTAAWRGPAEWVRWQGRCGRFEGQADLAFN